MKKVLAVLLSLLMVLSLTACTQKASECPECEECAACTTEDGAPVLVETGVASTAREGINIPTYITLPADFKEDATYPFVVMIHGHHGNHNEWGGYDAISNGLAAKGIIVATLDFSGCGASTEGIEENCMTNFKDDVLDVINYVKNTYKVSKVGGFGYSMGGRIILEMLNEDYFMFDAIEFVAPAESTEDLMKFFGGAESWAELAKNARETGEMSSFMSVFGEQLLSDKFFDDMEKYMDADDLAGKAAAKYNGNSLCIYATDDNVVYPEVSEKVAKAFNSAVVTVSQEGHSYSFYSTNPVVVSVVNNASIDFFAGEFLQAE